MPARSQFGRTAASKLTPLLAALLLLLPLALLARDKITQCVVEGMTYKNIFDVHVTSDGRIGIMYRVGGVSVERSELPKDFLESWGISAAGATAAAPKSDAGGGNQANADYLRYMQQQELEGVVNAGLIRRVDDKIYDLRKPQPGWESISGAKVDYLSSEGAVLELPNQPPSKRFIVVLNLPTASKVDESVTFWAKLVGSRKFATKTAGTISMTAYDYGHVCTKAEAPLSILTTGMVDRSTDSWAAGQTNRGFAPETAGARSLGSGFFVSPDGLLLTCYHVVARAHNVQINYRGAMLDATVAEVDKTNDLALIKVTGSEFRWIPIARDAGAALGEFVFTIGFPNATVQGWEPKYTEGTISGLDGLHDDPREYQISVPVQPGNSGGPVCNRNGEAVGVVRAVLTPGEAMYSSGALPQNVNYAVKSKFAQPLMDATALAREGWGANPTTVGADLQAARERVRAAVAMVVAY